MGDPMRPSLLERRDAVSRLADDQRTERNLYKRTYRSLTRKLRRGNSEAGLEAIKLLNQGKAAGIQMTGIPSADKNWNAAATRILDFQGDMRDQGGLVGKVTGTWANDADGGSSLVATPRRSDLEEGMSREVISGPNDGGNLATQTSGTPGTVAQDPGYNPNGPTSRLLNERKDRLTPGGGRAVPVFSTKTPGGMTSARGLPPIETEVVGFTGQTIIRDENGNVVGSSRPGPAPAAPEAPATPEPDRGPEPFSDFSDQTVGDIGRAIEGGDQLQQAIDLVAQVRAGEVDPSSLSNRQVEMYEEGEEYLSFKQEEAQVGREEALNRAAKRAVNRKKKRDADREAREEVVGDDLPAMPGGGVGGAPGGLLSRAQPRSRITSLLS